MNGEQICQWCFFEMKQHLGRTEHCKKMLRKLRTKIRIKNKCKRCGHDKKIHNAQQIEEENGKEIIILNTMCSHLKRGRGKDVNFDPDDFCDCRGYI